MPGADDTLNAGGPGPMLDPLDELCTCGHTRGEHHTLDEACCEDGCECCAFQLVNPEFGEGQPSEAQLRARVDAFEELSKATRNNTREAIDRDKTHADLAEEMDAEPMSPTAGMTDEERVESDAVQAETLANLCTCGHPYGVHTVADNHCVERNCVCLQFEPLLKPADGLDPKNLTFAHDENIGPAPEDIVDATGHKPYAVPEGADIIGNAEAHRGAIDHEALERDRRLPYTPPILRKRLLGEDELRQVLTDAGRLDLLAELPEPEVDRVTTNYGAEHWQEIEGLARFPQGSSETSVGRDRTTKAIALSLLDLRQSLGATIDNAKMLEVIERNTVAIQQTVAALDRIVGRVTGDDSEST